MEKKFLIILGMILIFNLISASSYNLEINEISPTSLVPGEENELSFNIENIGDADLDIIFSWEEESGAILPIGLSNTKSLELDEGDDETLDFDVFVSASAEPGLYELDISWSYEIGDETITKTSKAGIIIGGETDFDVAVSDFSGSGIILTVANIGKNPANSVSVSIPEQVNFQVSGSSSSIIGSLDTGDYSVASFEMSSSSRSASVLKVEIQYTDTLGSRQTITKNVDVPSSQQSFQSTTDDSNVQMSGFTSRNSGSNNNLFLAAFILSGVLVVILIIIFVKRKKSKGD